MLERPHPIQEFISAVHRNAQAAGYALVVTLLLPDAMNSPAEKEVAGEWTALPEALGPGIALMVVGEGVGRRLADDGLVDAARGLVRRNADVAIRGSRVIALAEPWPDKVPEGVLVSPVQYTQWVAERCKSWVIGMSELPVLLLQAPGFPEAMVQSFRLRGIKVTEYLRAVAAYLEPHLAKLEAERTEAETLRRKAEERETAADWLKWPLSELEQRVNELGKSQPVARRILEICADEGKSGPDRMRCFRLLQEVRGECGNESLVVTRLQSLIEQTFRRLPKDRAKRTSGLRESEMKIRQARSEFHAAVQAMVKARQPKTG